MPDAASSLRRACPSLGGLALNDRLVPAFTAGRPLRAIGTIWIDMAEFLTLCQTYCDPHTPQMQMEVGQTFTTTSLTRT